MRVQIGHQIERAQRKGTLVAAVARLPQFTPVRRSHADMKHYTGSCCNHYLAREETNGERMRRRRRVRRVASILQRMYNKIYPWRDERRGGSEDERENAETRENALS